MSNLPGRFFRQIVLGGAKVTYPSRSRIIDDLDALIQDHNLGSAALIVGPIQSGRSWVLEQLASRNLARPASRVQYVKISLLDGCPVIEAPGLIDTAIDLADLAGRGIGFLGAPSQALGHPAQAPKIVGGLVRGGATLARRRRQRTRQAAAQPSDLLRFIYSIKARKIVLLVDDIDEAPLLPLWWDRCFRPLVDNLRTDTGAPVTLILAACQPRTGYTRGSFPAASICVHDSLQIVKLVPLTRDETEVLTGPADAPVSDLLISASGGHPKAVSVIWQEMRRSGVVVRSGGDPQRPWKLTSGGHHVDALRLAGLRRRFPMVAGINFDRVETILAVASFEGNAFTVEAVAEFLNSSPKAVIQVLAKLESTDQPIIVAVENLAIPGRKMVRRYRFQDESDRLASMHFSTGTRSSSPFMDLATILMDLYGSSDWLVAPSIDRKSVV